MVRRDDTPRRSSIMRIIDRPSPAKHPTILERDALISSECDPLGATLGTDPQQPGARQGRPDQERQGLGNFRASTTTATITTGIPGRAGVGRDDDTLSRTIFTPGVCDVSTGGVLRELSVVNERVEHAALRQPVAGALVRRKPGRTTARASRWNWSCS